MLIQYSSGYNHEYDLKDYKWKTELSAQEILDHKDSTDILTTHPKSKLVAQWGASDD